MKTAALPGQLNLFDDSVYDYPIRIVHRRIYPSKVSCRFFYVYIIKKGDKEIGKFTKLKEAQEYLMRYEV